MARIIDLQFNDKTYSIEYNRASVLKLFTLKSNDKDEIEGAIDLIYCGLLKHHENDMPDRDEIVGWVLAMGEDIKPFLEELQKSIQKTLELVQSEQKSKNLKWGVRK